MAALSRDRIEKIESDAKQLLLDAYGEDPISLPIDLKKIADAAGIQIKEGKFPDPNISGVFERSSKTIWIPIDEPYRRKAFTIAHELGHFVLHVDKAEEVFYRADATYLGKPDKAPEETEANWFAASLLMPRYLVEKYAPYVKRLDELATMFGVSNQAMYYRLRNLGYTDFSLDG